MRLRQLKLIAFGPFAGQTLDFSGGAPGGVHVVYGRNEAGKSTALRAVSGLLFGIPERTQDAHLHPMQELRVGGQVEGSNGETLRVVRRKKRKDSLRDEHDAPLDEAALARMLGGMQRELFESLFGLDHQRLKAGGEALIAGRGDVGESLYEAGTGGQNIHALLSSLQREADELYKPRGQNPKLNAALDAYKQALRRSRDAALLPAAYFDQKRKLDEKLAERGQLERERRQLQRERDRKRRMMNGIKPAARRRELLAELEQLGPVPALPERAAERRQRAQRELAECGRAIDGLERAVQRLSEKRAAIQIDAALLELSPALLQRLSDGVAVGRQAKRDLPALRASIAAASDSIRTILTRVGRGTSLDDAQRLRLDVAEEQRIRDLDRERARLEERLEAAQRARLELERALRVKRLELERTPADTDPLELKLAYERAQAHPDLEARIGELSRERQALALRIGAAAAELQLAREQVSDELTAQLPPLETIEVEESALGELTQLLERTGDQVERERSRVRACERKLRSMQRGGELPTQEALEAARTERDQTWLAIRRALEGATPGAALAELLPRLESAFRTSDSLADALLREAARVAELSQARAELAEAEQDAELAASAHAAARAELARHSERWRALWSSAGISARSPGEMRVWRRRYAELCGWLERDRLVEHELRGRLEKAEEIQRELARGLGADAGSSEQLRALAAVRLREREHLAQQRRLLEASCLDLEARLGEARREQAERTADIDRWSETWRAATARLELGDRPSAGQVMVLLGELRELGRKLDELPELQHRAEKLEHSEREFAAEVAALLARFAPALAGLDCERAAEALVAAAAAARSSAREHDAASRELTEQERELEALRDTRARAERELSELIAAAQVSSAAELEALEQRASRWRDLREQIEQLEQQIRDTGDGLPLSELLAEIEGVERSVVALESQELESRLEELEAQLSDVVGDIRELETGLHRLSHGEEGAEAAQHTETLASDVRVLVERFARIRIARSILEREIARYRERNQGPVLRRASALFPRLTLGRYKELRVGLEEENLICVRRDGVEVDVTGLSEGAQYQLYLALRIATLERYLARSEPMPLVLDDVLLHFDDERARAAFEVLGELAERVQILFFTHHARHVELARDAVPAARLFVHELGVSPSPARAEDLSALR